MTPSVVLFVSLAVFVVGVFTGWFARERAESPASVDPESELRALREVHSGCAARIRGLHLELAQLETKLSMSRLDTPSRSVNATVTNDELEGAARLASLIDVLESGSDSGGESDTDSSEHEPERPAAFMSILPADLVESRARRETEPSSLPDEPTAERPDDVVGVPSVTSESPEAVPVMTEESLIPDGSPKLVVTLAEDRTVEVDVRQADDLTLIKGIGPKIESILHEHGITTFRQIADLDEGQIEQLASALGSFRGRIQRDDWIGAARQIVSQPATR